MSFEVVRLRSLIARPFALSRVEQFARRLVQAS